MSIADKLTQIAENEQRVYEAGYEKGKAEGGDPTAAYEQGVADGKMAEYDSFWDNYQNKGARGTYNRGFVGYGFNFENFYPKYDITIIGDGSQAFYAWTESANSSHTKGSLKKRFEDCGVRLDTSKATNLGGLFAYNNFITEVPTIDVTGLTYESPIVFAYSYNTLTSIEKIETKESVTYYNWFASAFGLKDVTFGGVIGQDIDFKDSSILSKASIKSIVEHLSDTASGKTLTLSKTAVENAFSNGEEFIELDYYGEHWVGEPYEGSFSFENGIATVTTDGGDEDSECLSQIICSVNAGTYEFSFSEEGKEVLFNGEMRYVQNGEQIVLGSYTEISIDTIYRGAKDNFVETFSIKRIVDEWDELTATKPNWNISLI